MKTIRNVILCVSLMFLCIAYSGREAFGAQDAGQTTATKPAQPEATARGSGATVHPLGDYVPCLFAADEVAGMRVLKPERTLEEGPKKIGANTALRVVDAMNAAIAKVIAGYGPASSPKNSGAGPSTKEDNSADLQLFVEEFAQKFFAYVDPDKLKDVTAVQAYGVLSDAARTVADKMSSEILNRTSAYDYFAYRRTTPDTKAGATLPANVQTAITEVENAILAAVRSASTEALEAEPPQLYEPPNDISCSISVMPWKETSDTFGRRVANQFLAIQVTVRNLNTKNEFLMHDIQVAVDTGLSTDGYFWKQYAGRFQAGRDKLLVRAVAQTGQSMSPRNLALNALIVVGAIAGSSCPVRTVDLPAINFRVGVYVLHGTKPSDKVPAIGWYHRNIAEIYYFLRGAGTFAIGGSLENPTADDPNNYSTKVVRGPSVSGIMKGFTEQKVEAGDLLIAPPGVPHVPGKVTAVPRDIVRIA